jgi:hypothetical protein
VYKIYSKEDKNMYDKTIEHEAFTQENTKVVAEDRINFNARHNYAVVGKDGKILAEIHFQEGPIKEAGLNGIFMEDLLLMCVDRLECFQHSEYMCKENEDAISGIMAGVAALRSRTNKRKDRGVEGTSTI